MDRKKILKASYQDCPVSDRRLFKYSNCLIPISVGQQVHEGDKFQAIIELVNRTFKSCAILIDDTIQRHTLKISHSGMSEAQLYHKAHSEGNFWVERNKSIYSKLEIPYQVIRWDDWLLHENFKEQLQVIDNLYNINTDYKDAVDSTITEYLMRKQRVDIIPDYAQATAVCLDYLKEECAEMTLWIEGKHEFELYPTGRNRAMAATHKYLIEPTYPHLLKSVALRFKKV